MNPRVASAIDKARGAAADVRAIAEALEDAPPQMLPTRRVVEALDLLVESVQALAEAIEAR